MAPIQAQLESPVMKSNAKKQLQPEGDSLDLDGLEMLLERAHLEVAKPDFEPLQSDKLVEHLLEQLQQVTDLVNDTSTRLNDANERFKSLLELVETQEKQMELMHHYQTQAARTASVENELAAVQAELEYHRRPWMQKLAFWVK